MLVLGLHSVQDAAAPGRGCARRKRCGRTGDGRRRGGARVARLHGLELLRRRPGALARRQRNRPASWQWPTCRPGCCRGGRRPAHRRPRRPRERCGSGHPADPGPARARGDLDEPGSDRDEGGAASHARARRRTGRCRDGAGGPSPRRRSRARRGCSDTCSRARPRRSARHSPRCCAATASNSFSASWRPQPAAKATSTSSSSTPAMSCAAIGCWSRPADGRVSRTSASTPSAWRPTEGVSRSICSFARASVCGRSATSPASGR